MHSNFTIYTPENPELKMLQDRHSIIFMKDDQNRDWYDIQKTLNQDMITIFCNAESEVVSASRDFTSIPPIAGGFCFQVEEYPYLTHSGKILYQKETQEFKLGTSPKTLNTLLKELRVLEIKQELGDEDISSQVLAKKQEILKLTSEE